MLELILVIFFVTVNSKIIFTLRRINGVDSLLLIILLQILKASKSPMKVLEDIDPNSMGSGDKENRYNNLQKCFERNSTILKSIVKFNPFIYRDVKKTRRSSSRRVSFAQTYEVK